MAYATTGSATSVFRTSTIESKLIGDFFNDLTKKYGTNWDIVHLASIDSGYVTYVTYRVDTPQDRAPATPVDDWEQQHPSVRYI